MDTLAAALIGGLAGGSIASIVAGLVTLVSLRREHAHQDFAAAQGRNYDRRAAAYADIAPTFLGYGQQLADVEPAVMIEPKPPPVALPDDNELRRQFALLRLAASPKVASKVESALLEIRRLRFAIGYLNDLRNEVGWGAPAGLADDLRKASDDVIGKRDAILTRFAEIENEMRSDLGFEMLPVPATPSAAAGDGEPKT